MNKTNQNSRPARLFDRSLGREVWRWLAVTVAFVASGVIGVLTGTSTYALNGFMIVLGLYGTLGVMQWVRRFLYTVSRSEQIIHEYTPLSAEAILARVELDDAVAAKAIQAKCLKAARGLGDGQESVMDSMELSLLGELDRFYLVAIALPGMGLAATCWGMMGTLDAIGAGAQDSSDIEAISEAVSGALPSMGLAVSTTLTGALFGSILLLGMVFLCRSKVQKFIGELNTQLDTFSVR